MESKAPGASAALALVLTMVVAAPASADEYCEPAAQPKASVLAIHGGAWMSGSAAWGREVCAPLAAMGYRVRSLEYPLWTVPGSIAYAHQAAQEEARTGRPVYAVGLSAGGTIAEYLAVKSRIDGAVAIAPLSDFVNWQPPAPGFWGKLQMTPSMRVRFSPYHNIERPAPLRLIHSPQDHTVPYDQSVRMVSRCGAPCELVKLDLGLGHISLGSRGSALDWFARRAANPTFASRPGPPVPVISRATLRPRTFTSSRAATIRYTLSEAALVSVTVERKREARGRRRRTGSFSIRGAAGVNRTGLSRGISGGALRPGAYRATLVASNPAGRRSRPVRLGFRVVARAPR